MSEYRERPSWEDSKTEIGTFPDNADRRRARLKRILMRIQINPGITSDQLIQLMIAWFGVTGRTAEGYLTELSRFGFIRQERLGTVRPDGSPDPKIDFGFGWFANESSKEFFK